MKLRHESQGAYIQHLLAMVSASRELIEALEYRATVEPDNTEEIGRLIEREQEIIESYKAKIRRVYALLGQKDSSAAN